jgi:hypothetical protein
VQIERNRSTIAPHFYRSKCCADAKRRSHSDSDKLVSHLAAHKVESNLPDRQSNHDFVMFQPSLHKICSSELDRAIFSLTSSA